MKQSHSTITDISDVPSAPVAVVMIALNEGHNMDAACRNVVGWAQEVFLVDSYSQDDTVGIALRHGVKVVQRRFRNFGDQWQFALSKLPITALWTMKLDPDERITDSLKAEIVQRLADNSADAFMVPRRQYCIHRPLPVRIEILRLWRTGAAAMSPVLVNEHVQMSGRVQRLRHEIEHHDSPDLDHWLRKQNHYTTAEAIRQASDGPLADMPRLLGTALQRRMFWKRHFYRIPFRYALLFGYHFFLQGAWKAGRAGYVWAKLRVMVMMLWEFKYREIQFSGRLPAAHPDGPGQPDPRVPQYE